MSWLRNTLTTFCLASSLLLMLSSAHADDSSRAAFTITFEGVTSDLPIMTTTIMPSSTLVIKSEAIPTASIGIITSTSKDWQWIAPSTPGRHEIRFEKNGETILLHVFVLTPFENAENAELNGYQIGPYRKTLFRGLSNYQAPLGFIDLSHGPADLKISPHFTLGQFICKQQPGHDPTYLSVRAETLIKLETLLEAANDKGWKADTFHIMSGFRTPFYNRSIGNPTTSSRHLYGGAADIWLDRDGDGQMDDLNGDGKITKDDARELARLAEALAKKGGRNWPAGGIGIYGPNSARGPFVHIDSRGYKARWGS